MATDDIRTGDTVQVIYPGNAHDVPVFSVGEVTAVTPRDTYEVFFPGIADHSFRMCGEDLSVITPNECGNPLALKYNKTEHTYLLRWEQEHPSLDLMRGYFQHCDSLEQAEELLASAKPGVVNPAIIRRTITEEVI